jgi:soluble lytic murein transglycosylase-like protein
MRRAICAVALGASALSLTACNTPGGADFVAKAPDDPVRESSPAKASAHGALDARIAHHAKVYGIPESLIHAAVQRESRYNPTLKHGPFWGLMQIRYDTARSVGYKGPPKGLLDADTNLTYGVAYLANAYRVAEGDERRAIKLYASGFYYEAKRKGLLGELCTADAPRGPQTIAAVAEVGK